MTWTEDEVGARGHTNSWRPEMRYVSPAWIMIAALMLMAPAAHAIPMTFIATLSGANELPNPVPSPGTGIATIVLDPTAQTLQVNATFSGLTSPDMAAHIHCCQPFGTNAGVATTVPAFPGFPLNVTSGTYSSQVFDLTQPLIYNPAFVTAQGSLAQAEAALIAGIESGQTTLTSTPRLSPVVRFEASCLPSRSRTSFH